MRSHRHVGRAQKAVAQRVEMKRIFLRGHVEHPSRHEPSGDVPDSRAHLQDFVANVRPELSREPAQILGRAGEIVENAAAIWGGIEVVDEPELEDDGERS